MSETSDAKFSLRPEDILSGLFSTQPGLREKVFEIARRLEALKEYNKDQAIFVAADIVRCRFLKSLIPKKENEL